MTNSVKKRYAAFIVTLAIIITSPILSINASASSAGADGHRVYPGGMPFGVRFYTDGVIVSGIDEVITEGGAVNPALDAGIKLKDIITHIDEKKITSAGLLSKAVADSQGKPVTLTVRRGDEVINAVLTPAKSKADGIYKAGLWLRDSTAGVGTVTFIDCETGMFGGLGHGICDSDTGKLLPLLRGSVSAVRIGGITKGIAGTPGELRGYFVGGKIGAIVKNTDCGVFGVLNEARSDADSIAIASKNEVCEGDAEIICTLDEGGAARYKVNISSIDTTAKSSKCFTVTVTDPALLEKTGGIVQGMRGSPIIQNGRIVGAVTHVFVNDPTRGYGIFIENMLEEAEKIK